MKAVIHERFGPPEVLELIESGKPHPNDNQVLIKNYASSVNTMDVNIRTGKPPKLMFWSIRIFFTVLSRILNDGIRKPRKTSAGLDYAGEIVQIGNQVTKWKIGDRVFGYRRGAYAEYICVLEQNAQKMPVNIDFEEAAAVPGAAIPAIRGLRDLGSIHKGQKVLIIGASGGIGSYAVQIAKIYETNVTGVCGPSNVEMVKKLGADQVIDYTKEDFTKNGESYDIIFDVIGKHIFSKCKNSLTDNGVYVANNPFNSKRNLLFLFISKFTKKKIKFGILGGLDNLQIITNWIEDGKLTSVIDTIYPLEEVAKAHKHYETGHSKGRIVIRIDHSTK
jgi:NADPH:quinone reductase-like Zn-dependent oxidoreductase